MHKGPPSPKYRFELSSDEESDELNIPLLFTPVKSEKISVSIDPTPSPKLFDKETSRSTKRRRDKNRKTKGRKTKSHVSRVRRTRSSDSFSFSSQLSSDTNPDVSNRGSHSARSSTSTSSLTSLSGSSGPLASGLSHSARRARRGSCSQISQISSPRVQLTSSPRTQRNSPRTQRTSPRTQLSYTRATRASSSPRHGSSHSSPRLTVSLDNSVDQHAPFTVHLMTLPSLANPHKGPPSALERGHRYQVSFDMVTDLLSGHMREESVNALPATVIQHMCEVIREEPDRDVERTYKALCIVAVYIAVNSTKVAERHISLLSHALELTYFKDERMHGALLLVAALAPVAPPGLCLNLVQRALQHTGGVQLRFVFAAARLAADRPLELDSLVASSDLETLVDLYQHMRTKEHQTKSSPARPIPRPPGLCRIPPPPIQMPGPEAARWMGDFLLRLTEDVGAHRLPSLRYLRRRSLDTLGMDMYRDLADEAGAQRYRDHTDYMATY